ncbi:hypothetical protein MKW98_008107 [Papaver atlanticum]|uniref:Uncharacterized protein n=1 Tax=Papaver atlanticum TaxID=357466 RepID=A0AAD4S839_9MAGN|nr:hypothetical protein MKW98_008107 [Papaver atlanticum]
MQAVSREGGNALALGGPRPMGWSTVPFNGTQATEPNADHQSAVYTKKFNPSGTVIASGSHDFLWNNAVLDLQWTTDGYQIISASPDKTLRAWDVETGKQIKKMVEHSSFVNSCCPSRRGPPLVVSGSDDGTAKLWDLHIFTGGIDNDVKVWDLRRNEVTMTLQGHSDTITGTHLGSSSIRFHNFEKTSLKCSWSADGSKVSAGSADRMVYIWDTTSRTLFDIDHSLLSSYIPSSFFWLSAFFKCL